MREQIDFDDPDSWERSMDNLILKAAIWQDEHWVDRSALLKVELLGAATVVLLSVDQRCENAGAKHGWSYLDVGNMTGWTWNWVDRSALLKVELFGAATVVLLSVDQNCEKV
jgi:hypothetical protein